MTLFNIADMVLSVPATGDNFPIVPVAAVGGIAIILAILAGLKKKNK